MLLTHNIRLNTQTDGQMASPEEKPNSLKKKKKKGRKREEIGRKLCKYVREVQMDLKRAL